MCATVSSSFFSFFFIQTCYIFSEDIFISSCKIQQEEEQGRQERRGDTVAGFKKRNELMMLYVEDVYLSQALRFTNLIQDSLPL